MTHSFPPKRDSFHPPSIRPAKWRTPGLRLTASFIAISAIGATAVGLLDADSGRAVQQPRVSLDMITAGNTYDEAANTMIVGQIENCSTSPAPGNNDRHIHIVHIVLHDAEDVVAWSVRLNYDGGRMRPSEFNSAPFAVGSRGKNVSFLNLPIDPASGVHRDLLPAGSIPPAAPEAQTAAFGAIYLGEQNFAVSPDTPHKAVPDDASYNAPSGGVLAALTLQVLPGQAGQASLTMDLDDNNPSGGLGTELEIWTGSGLQSVPIPPDRLGDGFHAEGTTCVPPAGIPPVAGVDPGLPDTSAPGDGGFAPPLPGATSPAGASPGSGDGTGGSPTATDGPRPGENATGSPTPDGESSDRESTGDGDDGIPAWVYVLVAIAIALAGGGAFAAWRYRSRLPWLGK